MPKMVPAGTDTLMWSTATVSPNRFTSSDTTSTTSRCAVSFWDVATEGERISPKIGAEGATSLEATGPWVDRLGAGAVAGSAGAAMGGAGARTEVDRGIVDRGIVDLGGVVAGRAVVEAAPGRAVSTSGMMGAAAKAGGGAGVGRFTGARRVVVLGVIDRGVEARGVVGFDAAGFDAAGFDAAGFDAAGFDAAAFDAAAFDVAAFDAAAFDVAGFAAAGFAVADFDPEGRGTVVRGAGVRDAGVREVDGLRACGAETGGVAGAAESSPAVGAADAPVGFSSGSESIH